MEKSNIWLKIIGVVVVIGVIVFAIFKYRDSENQNNTDNTQTTVTPPATPTPPPVQGAQRKYQDGTYEAEGTYRSPAQQETIRIEIVLKDDVITDAAFFENPSNPTTATMQGRFKAGFEQVVVGKKIDEVNLTVVNGSSLTPKGFMDALSKVKSEAEA